MVTLFFALAFAALLVFLIVSGVTLANALRLRFLPPEAMELSPLHVPADVRSALAPGFRRLLAFGFVRPAALRHVSVRVGGKPVPQHGLVLVHAKVPAAAYVVQLASPDRTRHYAIFFVSRTADGRTLLTRNRSSAVPLPPMPGVTVQDLWLPNWRALWRAHRAQMRLLEPDGKQWVRMPPSRWIEEGAAFETETFRARVLSGNLANAGDGSFRFGLGSALRMLVRAWMLFVPASRPMDEDRAAPSCKSSATGAPVDGAVASKVNTYEGDSLARSAQRRSIGTTWLLFIATAVAAGFSFGLSMGPGSLAALMAVLLVHELGHLAAMRWAGYTDLRVFFLPFIGAAASGRHDRPTPLQELVVLFAGPVPGLLIGLAALAWVPVDLSLGWWWRECAVLAIVLNAFNLLPIHPLDGGKIFEILFLSRWPWAAFAGRVAGLGALAAAAWSIDDLISRSVLLAVVFLLALGLPHQLRVARLSMALRATGKWGGLPRPDALEALFAAIGRLGYGAAPWPTQKLLVDELLPKALQPGMGRGARAGGVAAYGFFLVLPLLAPLAYAWNLVPAAVERSQAAQPAHRQPDDLLLARISAERNADLEAQRARIAATADPAERWAQLAVQLDLVADEATGELPATKALLDDAQALAPVLPDPAAKQAALAIWTALAATEKPVRLDNLRAAMALYDALPSGPADPGPLMRATALWLQEATDEDRGTRLARVDKALALGSGRPGLIGAEIVRAYKLDDLLRQGSPALAVKLAQGWFEDALRLGDGPALPAAAQSYVDLVLMTSGPAPALDLLDRVLARIEASSAGPAAYTDGLRRHGMWLAEAAKRPDWQQAQAGRLSASGPVGADQSLLMRALFWAMRGGRSPMATLADVDLAHWQGDSAGARRAAQRLLQQRPGFVVTISMASEALPGPDAFRLKMVGEARKAVYEAYGLTVSSPQ